MNGTFHEPAPLKYRSLQLTGDEKMLASLAATSLFGPSRLTLEMLACQPDALPLAWEAISDDGGAVVKQAAARKSALRHLSDKLFEGSSELLFTHLVSDQELSARPDRCGHSPSKFAGPALAQARSAINGGNRESWGGGRPCAVDRASFGVSAHKRSHELAICVADCLGARVRAAGGSTRDLHGDRRQRAVRVPFSVMDVQ